MTRDHRSTSTLLATVLLALASTSTAVAQVAAHLDHVALVQHYERDSVDRIYILHNLHAAVEQNEALTAIQNMADPMTKIFLDPSQKAIVIHAPVEEQERIAKLIVALDRPHPRYQLTYTITELDGTRTIGVQHFSMLVVAGQRSQLKEGSRIPLLAGPARIGESTSTVSYIDVGLNFDATLDEVEGGGSLKTHVEQTSVAPDSTNGSGGNPVIRQTSFEGAANLVLGKPATLGSLDVPSSTHHFDIAVVLQPMN